jgi:trehalose synthase
VAEMLPRQVALLRELGVDTKWLVIGTERDEFFALTKRIHNLIHGSGEPGLGAADRELYDTVSRELCDEIKPLIAPNDLIVVHDPQPAGVGALLRRELDIVALWRCHIGLDQIVPQTEDAWEFLRPHLESYDCSVFTAAEYVPSFMRGNVALITPAIDPLTDKNRPLSAHALTGILCNSGLMLEHNPVVRPAFAARPGRLRSDGAFGAPVEPDEIGLLFRPTVTQISRWDRLKGWKPLLDGFVKLKRERDRVPGLSALQQRRLGLVRLVLAGPEPASVADDPEAKEVLDELRRAYCELRSEIASDVVILSLPMASIVENALMVNALQNCSSIVVQNSLQEGFGLTVTEAMWKRIPVLGAPACGIRQQIRDDIDGRLHHDALDPEAIASALLFMLGKPKKRAAWGRSGQRRVYDEFLIFSQLRRWIRVLAAAADRSSLAPSRPSLFPKAKSELSES